MPGCGGGACGRPWESGSGGGSCGLVDMWLGDTAWKEAVGCLGEV